MGWEVYIGSRFRERRDPIDLFMGLATGISRNKRYGQILRLRLRRHRYNEAPMIDLYSGDDDQHPVTIEDTQRVLREYHGHDLAVECWWEASRRYLDKVPEDEPELVGYRAILTVAGEDYYWPTRPSQALSMMYDVGDYKQFWPSLRGQSARLNVEAVVEELSAFSSTGVDTMVGLNADRSLEPNDLYLCYHRHPEDYDAELIAQGHLLRRSLSSEDVLDAALACEEVSFKEADQSIIVYHRDFVGGDLRHFYGELAALSS